MNSTQKLPSEITTFMGACQHYFGRKPNQPLKEFSEEVKALTDQDRSEMTAGLKALGYAIQ